MGDLADKIRAEFERPFWRATEASSSGAKKTMSAVRAVLDLHKPGKVYDECGHEHEYADDGQLSEGVKSVEEVGLVCEDGFVYSICQACCMEDDYQTETCATDHPHAGPSACWPCPTIVAMASSLGVVSGTGDKTDG